MASGDTSVFNTPTRIGLSSDRITIASSGHNSMQFCAL